MLRRTLGSLLGSKKAFPVNISDQMKVFVQLIQENSDVRRAVQHLSKTCNKEQREEGLKWLTDNGPRLCTEDSVKRWADYVKFVHEREFPLKGNCNAKISWFHAKQRQRPQSTPRWKRKRVSPLLPRRDALGRFVPANGKRARRRQGVN
jgi:hypothetical protein